MNQHLPSVSMAPSSDSLGVIALSLVEVECYFGFHAFLAKLDSFSQVSSKLMMRFFNVSYFKSYSANYWRKIRHLAELHWDGTLLFRR